MKKNATARFLAGQPLVQQIATQVLDDIQESGAPIRASSETFKQFALKALKERLGSPEAQDEEDYLSAVWEAATQIALQEETSEGLLHTLRMEVVKRYLSYPKGKCNWQLIMFQVTHEYLVTDQGVDARRHFLLQRALTRYNEKRRRERAQSLCPAREASRTQYLPRPKPKPKAEADLSDLPF